MLHYKEISYQENIEDLKKYKKDQEINVKIIEVKDDKIKFSVRALEKDPLDWFKDNKKSWRYYYDTNSRGFKDWRESCYRQR